MEPDVLSRLTQALSDRYRVERELGAGGMATVYLAEDLRHGRKVAIKVLREDLGATLGKERFHREIRIAAALQHPHVLPLYDSGEADGLLFYVMPYVDGPSLRSKLLREGELPVSDAVRILRDVADALAEAHRFGVVHRDLKPENVMLRGRHALVTDFGVAKAVSDATGETSLTTLGVALGTPTYMSPEQATGDPHVDQRADIYAFGILAYELLTGHPPFTGTPQQVLAQQVTVTPEPIAKLRTIPATLSTLVMRSLEKKAADRWQTADELVPQLESVLTPSGGITPTDTRPSAAVSGAQGMGHGARTTSGIGYRGWAIGAVVVAAAVITFLATRNRDGVSATSSATAADSVPSVGVIPFTETNAPAGQEFFADGLTDEVIIALSRIPGIRVPGRESSFRFKGSKSTSASLADSLGVHMLLSGNVIRSGGSVRVQYSLVKGSDGIIVKSDAITRPATDVFALYDSVARSISGALAVKFQSTASASAVARQVNPDAYQAYLQGKTYLANRVVDSSLMYLTKATTIDSGYADAWAALGTAFSIAGPSDYLILSADSAVAGAQRAVARAMALDTMSAEVWNAAGGLAQRQFRWDDALKAYDRALQINPGFVSALQVSAIVLAGVDRVPEAMTRIRRAQEIDPLSFIVSDWAMILTWLAGDHASALSQADRLVALNPRNERVFRDAALMYARARRWDRAAELYAARYMLLGGDSATASKIRTGLINPTTRAATARVIESTGRVQWRAADLLLAAGDSAAAIKSLKTMDVKPGAFGITFKSWITEPGVTNSREFRNLAAAGKLPVR